MLKNNQVVWGSVSRLFHWGMALLFIGMYIVAYIMTSMEPSPTKWELYGIHKATGLTLLLLVALRIAWRLSNEVPSLPKTMPIWQVTASNANIYLLYICMFLMPISGVVMSLMGGHDVSYFGIFTLPALTEGPTTFGKWAYNTHIFTSYGLIGLVSLHILAGIYHHFILRDSVFKRMFLGKDK